MKGTGRFQMAGTSHVQQKCSKRKCQITRHLIKCLNKLKTVATDEKKKLDRTLGLNLPKCKFQNLQNIEGQLGPERH